MSERIFIKNMVCNRCITAVNDSLEKLGIELSAISLGEVEIRKTLTAEQKEKLAGILAEQGFELIEDKRAQLIEKIKKTIIEFVHYNMNSSSVKTNLSELLTKSLDRDYSTLSALFSTCEGITIEHYLILQKIERVKELIKYDELSLAEIAYRLGYSSLPHLSSQFKKTTGMTITQFKKNTTNFRKPLDMLN